MSVENWNEGDGNVSEQEKINRFMDFVIGSNQDFYDNYLINLTKEELELFMKNNPDFLEGLKPENGIGT